MSNELNLTWDDGESLSNETVDVGSLDKAIGIFFETGFNTTAVSFEIIMNDKPVGTLVGSIRNLDSSEYTFTVNNTLSEYVPLNASVFAGVNKFKVRRGTQAAPYTTNAEDTIVRLIRRAY